MSLAMISIYLLTRIRPRVLPPCPESWSSFRAEVHVGDSGPRFAGCGGNRRLRLQLRGHGAVPKVETALLSCHWPSRGVLSLDVPALSAVRSCLACGRAPPQGPAAPLRLVVVLVPEGQRPLRLGLPAQPGFVGRSSRKARPICGEEVGRGRLCRGGHAGWGEALG